MKYALPISILFTFALTNLRVISDDIIIFSHHTKPLYQDRALMESLVWLKNNSSSEQKVLTDSSIGNLVPAYSGRQVYIGHYDQTVDPAEKENLIQLVFSANNESTLKNFLITQKLDYVFVDQEIRDLGFSDTNKPYLKLVFDNSDVQIYKVQ